MSYHRPEDSYGYLWPTWEGRGGDNAWLRGNAGGQAWRKKNRRKTKKQTLLPPWKHIPQRVKVSWKYLPTNKNLKLKRTSYITLSIYHINQFSKKNTFQVQTYYLCYNIYKYSRIIQFIARTLFGYYKICKGIYLYIKKRGVQKAARRARVTFELLKCQVNVEVYFQPFQESDSIDGQGKR